MQSIFLATYYSGRSHRIKSTLRFLFAIVRDRLPLPLDPAASQSGS
jgi:hypothetical protein